MRSNWHLQGVAIFSVLLSPAWSGQGTTTALAQDVIYMPAEGSVVMQEERYIVQRPVWEWEQREERYTVRRPVYETSEREETYTVTRPVYETAEREEQVTVYQPVTTMRSTYVGWGTWMETPVTTYLPRTELRKVPVQTVRYVQEQHVRKVPVTHLRYVEEQKVRKVPVQTVRYVEEEAVRKVQVPVQRIVEQEVVRKVPVTTYRPMLAPTIPNHACDVPLPPVIIAP